MPTSRYSKLTPEARRRILDAARAEFIQLGYDDASVNQIAQAAGINKGSLYYYFEDKADLFVTVARDAQDELIRSLTGSDLAHVQSFFEQSPADFWDFMLATTMQKVAFYRSHPHLMRLFSDLYRQIQRAGAPARFREFFEETRKAFLAFIKMGKAQGAIRTDLSDDLLVDLGQALSELMNRPLLEDPELVERFDMDEMRAYAAIQLDMMKRMLQVPEGGTQK